MDPVSLLGAVAAASQLVAQGSEILVSIYKMYSKIKSAPEFVRNGSVQVEQLISISRLVIQNPALQTDSIASVLSTCLAYAKKLQSILIRLTPRTGSGKLTRLEKALMAVIKEGGITDLFRKLEREKTSLTLCIEEINSALLRTIDIEVQGVQDTVGDLSLVVSDTARNTQTVINVLEGTASQVTTVYEAIPEVSNRLSVLQDDMLPALISLLQLNKETVNSTGQDRGKGYFNIPSRRVRIFFGREDILNKLQKGFSPNAPPESAPRCIVLRGLGGQGKSQIALEYCQRTKKAQYSTIFWIDATSEGTARRSFKAFFNAVKGETDTQGSVDDVYAFVRDTLENILEPWLLVLDNYDDPSAFENIQDFLALGQYGSILITSRNASINALASHGWAIEVGGLDEADARDLLFASSQLSADDHSVSGASAIVRRLACHPLAIVQAGAYISSLRLPLNDFMDHYHRRKQHILEHTPQMTQYRRSLDDSGKEISLNVFTTWELSFHQLRLGESQNYIKADLLTLLAFFNGQDISEEMFQVFCANIKPWNSGSDVKGLPGAFLEERLGKWDSDIFADILAKYFELSLIQDFGREEDGFYHLSLHPLVKDWIKLRTSLQARQEYFMLAAEILLEVLNPSELPEGQGLSIADARNIVSHIVSQDDQDYELEEEASISTDAIPVTLVTGLRGAKFSLASLLFQLARYKEASQLQKRIFEVQLKTQGPEDLGTIRAKLDLASSIFAMGQFDEAEKLLREGLEVAIRLKGYNDEITNDYTYGLGWALLWIGKFKESQAIFEKLLERCIHTEGLSFWRTKAVLTDLTLVKARRGEFEEANELYKQAIALFEEEPGVDNSNLIYFRDFCLALMFMSRLSEAKELLSRILEPMRAYYGKEHPETMLIQHKLAILAPDLNEAENTLRSTAEILEDLYGSEHPDTLEAYSDLGVVAWRLGQLDKAEQHLRHAVDLLMRTKGETLPETLSSMCSLALVMRDQGRLQDAEDLLQRAIARRIKVYGPENPFTKESMEMLQSVTERITAVKGEDVDVVGS